MRTIAEQLVAWIKNEGVPPGDICILYVGKALEKEIENTIGPALRSIGASLAVQRGERFSDDSRAVIATTPHSFKGYDKELVILAGVDAFAEANRATTLYVAMTRARSLLALYGWDRPLSEVQSLFSTVTKCLAKLTNPPAVEQVIDHSDTEKSGNAIGSLSNTLESSSKPSNDVPLAQPKPRSPFTNATVAPKPGVHVAGQLLTNKLGISFAWIPPGGFLMGSPAGEIGREGSEGQYNVRFSKGFFMGIYPVTQAQWKKVMGDNPSRFQDAGLPVEQVSWHQCVEFCRRISELDGRWYRLPSESEWEYACRAGTSTPFYFGETISADLANFDANYLYGSGKKGTYRQKTTPVDAFAPNAWGLFDVHGNVWEWCHDWYGVYPTKESVDYRGPINGTGRVIRGGAWNQIPGRCRSAYRGSSDPRKDRKDVGFRICFSER